METSNFEAVKVAIKQDSSGYILTLRMHPDEVPEPILRDFVGARYQVVVVRIADDSTPMNRDQELSRDMVRSAGILCRDKSFWQFLVESSQIIGTNEYEATEWLKKTLQVASRSDISKDVEATSRFYSIKQEFNLWKQENA
jgi:hypothetical protein